MWSDFMKWIKVKSLSCPPIQKVNMLKTRVQCPYLDVMGLIVKLANLSALFSGSAYAINTV